MICEVKTRQITPLYNPPTSTPCASPCPTLHYMAHHLPSFWGLSLFLSLLFAHSTSTSPVYIVYLGLSRSNDPLVTSKSHLQLLSNVFSNEEEAKQSILYSYKHSFSGFSAELNSTQATALKNMKGVISVFRSKTLKLHTTRSWDFLGLPLHTTITRSISPLQLKYGNDVVVAILDTGIWPERESFKEEREMGPIPSYWKGQCVKGEEFEPKKACNCKLIGARYYLKGFEQQYGSLNNSGNREYRSARDFLGHGTHTASTAVGSIVRNASFFGFGEGIARGGAPRARLAVYKVCWGKNFDGKCAEADIMAAFDDALHDGVNVISASFGANPPLLPFFASSADIGAFHAMQLGVTVVFSAGNGGPDSGLVQNIAPWSICVAASSIDRMFPTRILLDTNLSLMGESIITNAIRGKLVSATTYFLDGVCATENWNKRPATGRVVLCFSSGGAIGDDEIGQGAVKGANGSALIFASPPGRQIAGVDIVPTVRVDISIGTQIQYYLAQSPKLPVVQILPSETVIGKSPAPVVAPFSSRGPSSISPDFLKPDITAPGINILAAWPPKTPPTVMPFDERRVDWNFQSGTSMSCPHVSAVVALLKSAHPTWSPAAIRSALITTAYTRDTSLDSILAGGTMKESDAFDIGAGHINPSKAMDPGLVYDMKTPDYITFLCNIGYTKEQIKNLVLNSSSEAIDTTCSPLRILANANINYPSITVFNLQSSMTIRRTVRNVGPNQNAIYFVGIVKPHGVDVMIWPRVLIFSCFRKEITYFVTLKPIKKSQGRYDFGEIVWSDGFHKVRSPLIVLINTTIPYSYSTPSTFAY